MSAPPITESAPQAGKQGGALTGFHGQFTVPPCVGKRVVSAGEIARQILGDIDEEGYCTCPGASLHRNVTRRRCTRVYLAGIPTINCLHSSCAAVLAEANHALRSAIAKAEFGAAPVPLRLVKSPEQIQRERERIEAGRLVSMAKDALPRILRKFRWPLEDLWGDSPDTLDDVENDWRRLLSLFVPAVNVWIGDRTDSGQPRHAQHFRRAGEWLELNSCPPGPHVSPFAYRENVCSRKAVNVLERCFLIVESDDLSKDDQGAVLRWLREACGLRLRAVVDTAGRSVHGWFDVPAPEVMRDLSATLPGLGCDPALLRITQVSRLPSCRRGDKTQSLLYFDGRDS